MKAGVILFSFFSLIYFTNDAESVGVRIHGKSNPLTIALVDGLKDCIDWMLMSRRTLHMVLTHQGLAQRSANCVRACALQASGLMNNTELDIEKAVDLLSQAKNPQIEIWTAFLKECKKFSEDSDDRCTVAGKYAICYRTANKVLYGNNTSTAENTYLGEDDGQDNSENTLTQVIPDIHGKFLKRAETQQFVSLY